MSYRRTGGTAAVNGFTSHSLTVAEADTLFRHRYPVPLDYRCPSGGWRMVRNGVPVPPVPKVGIPKWFEAVHGHQRELSAEKRRSELWRAEDNDEPGNLTDEDGENETKAGLGKEDGLQPDTRSRPFIG